MPEMDPLNECSLLSSHENAGNGPPQLEAMETAEINPLNKMFLLKSHEKKQKSTVRAKKIRQPFFWIALEIYYFVILYSVSAIARYFICALFLLRHIVERFNANILACSVKPIPAI